ncbi:carboxylesterase/lipase family protein [Pseudonocardiaceae bacterium YIM PH 21723]|nr:carboxylesterase/lipase family protein [Pseudonocardiaceae bacterium YIM PH 21723]
MTARVHTTAGTVQGTWEDGVAVFRGVPFAAPPVGPRRFAAPQPPEPWDGIREATEFGTPPPQPRHVTTGDDWLTLAVWTPAPGRTGLPVVVWISGGKYLHCNTANPHFAGAVMASEGVVVVSAHYRSGFKGFAHLDGAPGNRGLLDQLATLRWVRDNITAFGGDPANVTVLGQSAGAGSIAALLAMPAAAGLFRRAILQSLPGTYFTPALATDIATEISAELGRSPRAADLAAVPPRTLVEATGAVTARLRQRWGPVVHTPTPFSPVVDGDILPTAPWAALGDGAARGVELLIGHTRDEFSQLGSKLGDIGEAELDTLIGGLTPTPGHRRYRTAYPDLTPPELRETALSDWLFRMPALHLAEAAHAGGADVRLSELTWGFGGHGASHTLDTLLVFGTAHIGTGLTAAGPEIVEQARQLSALMRSEYLLFAATGDPGWPRYDRHDRATRVYGTTPTVTRYPEESSRAIWCDRRFGVLDLPG